MQLKLCLHSIIGHSSRPNPEAKPSIAQEGGITTLLIFEVSPGKETGKVKSPEYHTNEEGVAMFVTDPRECHQRTNNEREHSKNRSDIVSENDRGRAYAVFHVFVSVLFCFHSAYERYGGTTAHLAGIRSIVHDCPACSPHV